MDLGQCFRCKRVEPTRRAAADGFGYRCPQCGGIWWRDLDAVRRGDWADWDRYHNPWEQFPDAHRG